jgi:hypothetical protein
MKFSCLGKLHVRRKDITQQLISFCRTVFWPA